MSRSDEILDEGAATEKGLERLVDDIDRLTKVTRSKGVLDKQLQEEDSGFKKDMAKLNKTLETARDQAEQLTQEYQMAYRGRG